VTSDSYGADIYTEAIGDPDTLANLGPLGPMAGTWEGAKGSDQHPVAEGTEHDVFVEQLFYGLRYHTHILKPTEAATFHDQVGYWLWEPAANAVTLTLGIPRGQVLLASGPAEADAKEFEVTASVGTELHGILSNPFLDRAFRTRSYRMHVSVNDDGTWSYEEEGVLEIPGVAEPFSHIDRNTLTRIAPPVPNPLSRTGTSDSSLGIGGLRNMGGNI
jgi:hypothetical protein